MPPQMAFYGSDVVHCLPFMSGILRETLYNPVLFREHRTVIKKATLSFIKRMDGLECQEGGLLDMIIAAIVDAKIDCLFIKMTTTRAVKKKKETIRNETRKIRTGRLKEEAHLGCSFSQDVVRSVTELNFVLQRQNVSLY